MDFLPKSVSRLIDELSQLPGIGPKSAQRLAFYMLKRSESKNENLGESVAKLQEGVLRCQQCHCLTSTTICSICDHPGRNHSLLCVVETTLDLMALEKTKDYKGLYHVLQGKLSPLDGIGPGDIRMAELFERLTDEATSTTEVILALNPDLEGDTTALFIQKKLSSFHNLSVTRIARGIPSGGHLEYTDDATLIRALRGRQQLSL